MLGTLLETIHSLQQQAERLGGNTYEHDAYSHS